MRQMYLLHSEFKTFIIEENEIECLNENQEVTKQ